MSKTILSIIVVVCLGVGALLGHSFWPSYQLGASSAVDTVQNTAKIASIVMAPTTASATSSSIYNGDSTDRIIESSFVSCNTVGTSRTAYTGAGLASWLYRAATTSTAAPAVLSNTNYAMNITVSTSTADAYTASSTEPVLGAAGRVWASGSYLTFQPNATNTATCVVGVHYLAS